MINLDLSGKRAVITGASLGIGEATVKMLAEHGANVVFCARTEESVTKLASTKVKNGSINGFVADMGKKDSTQVFIDHVLSEGGVDILVNNASTFYPTPIEEVSEDHWNKLIGSNLKGPLFLIQGLKDKLKLSKGSIINITDSNLKKGVPNYSIYSAAKAGLEAITKSLARELAPDIKVNAVAPGAMLEPPDVTWSDEQKSKVIENIPLNRMGSEKDIAETVKFLAHSEYITGQIIKVDGGRSL